jgi:predicted acetyltransferase
VFCDDPAWRREAGGQLRVLVHEGHDGRCDGYLAYRRKEVWRRFVAAGTLHVVEAYADDPMSYLALWRVALESDLVATVSTWHLPVDDPLRHALVDTRRLSVAALHDGLWLRVLDVERALTARAYRTEDELVLEVVDPHRPRNDGCYHLQVGPDGSSCARTNAAPHLGLDVADLGSLYLGGVSATALAGAGRIHEFRPGAVGTADRVFAHWPAPFLGTEF